MFEDDDECLHVKMGRFSDAAENLVRRAMGKRFRLKGGNSPARKPHTARRKSVGDFHMQAWANRADCVAQGPSYCARPQAIVKAAKNHKTIQGVRDVIGYVARSGKEGHGAIPMWDGYGHERDLNEVMNIPGAWGLMEDDENLSASARTLLKEGNREALSSLSDQKRFHHIQSWHFIFSIEEPGGAGAIEARFCDAVKATVDRVFTAQGYRVVWGLHRDHTDHLHGHAIVRALSDFGGRWHSDIHGNELHAMRVEFARNLRLLGLDYEATRRVDRRSVRDKILSGRGAKTDHDVFARVPGWVLDFGRAAEGRWENLAALRKTVGEAISHLEPGQRVATAARIIREALRPKPKKTGFFLSVLFHRTRQEPSEADVPKQYRALFEIIRPAFHNPVEAISAWQGMAMEGAHRDQTGKAKYPNRSLANWVVRHRPELFGDINPEAFDLIDNDQLKKELKKLWLPKPEYVPVVEKTDEGLLQDRAIKRAHRDRKEALANLKRLEKQAGVVFGEESWRTDVLRSTVDRAQRVQFDEQNVVSVRVKRSENDIQNEAYAEPKTNNREPVQAVNENSPPVAVEPLSRSGRKRRRSQGHVR